MLSDRIKQVLLSLVVLLMVSPLTGWTSTVERDITDFIKRVYPKEDVQISINQLPQHVKEANRLRTVSFAKVPDAAGDGVCVVGIEGKNGSNSNAFVPFKVFVKKRLYVLNRDVKKGETIGRSDVTERETYLQGSGAAYPSASEEVFGSVAKKEMSAGEVIAKQYLEAQMAVAKGDFVNVTAENKRLVVQAKGMALEKGRLGDMVRVRSASGREVVGRVTGNSTVSVQF